MQICTDKASYSLKEPSFACCHCKKAAKLLHDAAKSDVSIAEADSFVLNMVDSTAKQLKLSHEESAQGLHKMLENKESLKGMAKDLISSTKREITRAFFQTGRLIHDITQGQPLFGKDIVQSAFDIGIPPLKKTPNKNN